MEWRSNMKWRSFDLDDWPHVCSLPGWAKDRAAREGQNRKLERQQNEWLRDRKRREAERALADD